jgi:hypothetical protein
MTEKNYLLTLVDLSGIQRYIFKSNTLKHIMGASGLVHLVTHDWLEEALKQQGLCNRQPQGKNLRIEDGKLVSEVIYQEGGNALILFSSKDTAHGFAKALSLRALREAPGLDMVITHAALPADVFIGKGALFMPLQSLFQKVNEKKMDRARNAALPGLGVTAACPYTQKPATHAIKREGGEQEWVSAEIHAKEMVGYQAATDQFAGRFKGARGNYAFLKEFSEFSGGAKGSYMAVVHADGTGMGQRLMDYLARFAESSTREAVDGLRAFSESITDAVQQAMDDTIICLRQKIEQKVIPSKPGMLPFRPIVCDGDDITFVCDGTFGLPLTAQLLKAFAKFNLIDTGEPIAMRAGVAIVKSHFPFSQAYELAEDLNRSARNFARKNQGDAARFAPMAIDWHISTSGTLGSLEALRCQYENKRAKLLLRPLLVGAKSGVRRWAVLEELVGIFGQQKWQKIRSKLRELEDVFLQGKDAVERFLTFNSIDELPRPAAIGNIHLECGFVENDKQVLHYDALEVAEFFAFSSCDQEQEVTS